MIRVKAGAVLVITDKEYGATFTGTQVWVDEEAIVLTVRDDATMEQRLEMAAKAAAIKAAGGTT